MSVVSLPAPQTVYDSYDQSIAPLLGLFHATENYDLLFYATVISYFTTNIVPKMMVQAGTFSLATGSQKKQWVIDNIKYILSRVLDRVDLGEWEFLESAIVLAVDPTINLLIEVEQDQIQFNTRALTVAQKIKKFLLCQK